ncbi:sigma-54-dependent Fis family transcriptional regulator [candidate division KSB1 bacterium]|nr:sigma-54-dependent Fis family transcriptional regulator [candidate division KSB1 bacterium]
MEKIAALAKFSEDLLITENEDNLYNVLADGVVGIIGCDQVSIMTFISDKKKLKQMQVRGFDAKNYRAPRIELVENVTKWLYDRGEVFVLTEEGKNKFLILFDQDESKYFNCELRIPLFAKRNIICILNIGKKTTGTEYSEEDIEILRIIVNLAHFAIEKSIVCKQLLASQHKKGFDNRGIKSLKNIQIKRRVEQVKMIGLSKSLQQIHNLVDRVAEKDVTILITGESGTGKDLVARMIHQKSNRRDKPFVAMNCAALPDNLVESELFGHEKGAFTGAHVQKKGKFEYANSGTLFLDEIGDMSLATQAKLLRVLQDGTYHRTGGNDTLRSHARIIAATNKNIFDEIPNGKFREDLYYRINVVQIAIPPLREHKEDIPELATYFFDRYNSYYDKNIKNISSAAMKKLSEYDFPGNVRELQNIMERAVIMEYGDSLSLDFIPGVNTDLRIKNMNNPDGTLEDLEKEHIKIVIQQVDYNKSQAARILGIARKTLREKMQKYNLN